jgi:hypothetical protein
MDDNSKVNIGEKNLPPDAIPVKHIGSMGIYFSKSEHSLLLQVADYHSGLVRLSEKNLMEFINIMNKSTEDIEREILAEIEDDDLTKKLENIISKDKSRERFRGAKIRLVLPDK